MYLSKCHQIDSSSSSSKDDAKTEVCGPISSEPGLIGANAAATAATIATAGPMASMNRHTGSGEGIGSMRRVPARFSTLPSLPGGGRLNGGPGGGGSSGTLGRPWGATMEGGAMGSPGNGPAMMEGGAMEMSPGGGGGPLSPTAYDVRTETFELPNIWSLFAFRNVGNAGGEQVRARGPAALQRNVSFHRSSSRSRAPAPSSSRDTLRSTLDTTLRLLRGVGLSDYEEREFEASIQDLANQVREIEAEERGNVDSKRQQHLLARKEMLLVNLILIQNDLLGYKARMQGQRYSQSSDEQDWVFEESTSKGSGGGGGGGVVEQRTSESWKRRVERPPTTSYTANNHTMRGRASKVEVMHTEPPRPARRLPSPAAPTPHEQHSVSPLVSPPLVAPPPQHQFPVSPAPPSPKTLSRQHDAILSQELQPVSDLLGELRGTSSELYTCLETNVQGLRTRLKSLDSPAIKNDVDNLDLKIPGGTSDTVRLHLRGLLEVKSSMERAMKLVMGTFGALTTELARLQDDVRSSENARLHLSEEAVKKGQLAEQYSQLASNLQKNNLELQQSLASGTADSLSLQEMKRALQAARSECESLQRKNESVLQQQRQQQEQYQAQLMSLKSERESSNQASMEEMRRRYESQLADQAAERDREVSSMKMRIESFQQQSQSSSQGSDQRLAELQRTISQQEQIIATLREEMERLRMSMSQRSSTQSSTVVNTTVKRETEYPYLRLVPTYGECVYSNYSVQNAGHHGDSRVASEKATKTVRFA